MAAITRKGDPNKAQFLVSYETKDGEIVQLYSEVAHCMQDAMFEVPNDARVISRSERVGSAWVRFDV